MLTNMLYNAVGRFSLPSSPPLDNVDSRKATDLKKSSLMWGFFVTETTFE